MRDDIELPVDYPLFDDSVSFEDCQSRLHALGLGDGLPLVPPTKARLARMLEGVREPATSWGNLPPLMGELRPDALGYQCVLAGCPPAGLGLVMTALHACLEPQFNLLGITTTTGTAAVAMVVHGPLARELGLISSSNCLRSRCPCQRRLRPRPQSGTAQCGRRQGRGVGDMATMGQSGKFSFCLAETANAPLPSLSERRGLDKERSAVTVMGVSGTAEVLPLEEAQTGQAAQTGDAILGDAILAPIAAAMGSAIGVSGTRTRTGRGEQIFFLPPELAGRLTACGWTLAAMQTYLFDHARVPPLAAGTAGGNERAARSAEAIQPIVTGGPGIKMTYAPLWSGGTVTVTRAVPSTL
ncbi:MAG: hypothetical protein GKR94_04275 [Gammaproteobacteria bacterium]|nr:hypothetical protein [Gammaproteobacteria bacterium]